MTHVLQRERIELKLGGIFERPFAPPVEATGEALVVEHDDAVRGFEQKIGDSMNAASSMFSVDDRADGDLPTPYCIRPTLVYKRTQRVAGTDQMDGIECCCEACSRENRPGDIDAMAFGGFPLIDGEESVKGRADLVPGCGRGTSKRDASCEALDGGDPGGSREMAFSLPNDG